MNKGFTPTPKMNRGLKLKIFGVSSQSERGFTIIESLVAITILVLAVTGAASAIQIAISSYIFSKDQVIAFYLAQEGFEQVRNIRDENSLRNQNWLTGLSQNSSDPCYFGNACIADSLSQNGVFLTRCPGNCPVLQQDMATGFFGYNSLWPDTVFRREIVLSRVNAREISVLVTIDWSKGLVNRQFRARENLLNWQQ